MENEGKRTVHTRDVGILLSGKIKSKKVSRGKGKQEYRASDSRNRQLGSTWSK